MCVECRIKVHIFRYFVALVVALDGYKRKHKPRKIKVYKKGNRKNETRYRWIAERREKYII